MSELIAYFNSVFGEYSSQIEFIAIEFATFTKANPVVGGLMGVWVVGMLTYVFREVPRKILAMLRKQFTVRITLESQDEIFRRMGMLLEELGVSTKNRSLRAVNGRYGHSRKTTISSGYG